MDLLPLIAITLTLALFGAGVTHPWWNRKRAVTDPVGDLLVATSLALMALVTVASVLTMAGIRGVSVGQWIFAGIVLIGLVRVCSSGARSFRCLKALSWRQWAWYAGLSIFLAYTAIFWAKLFDDVIALPSFHDGIVHGMYFLRILESGYASLGRVPIGFGEIFGIENFDFYPTGTHALMAMSSGLWVRFGIFSAAEVCQGMVVNRILAHTMAFVVGG